GDTVRIKGGIANAYYLEILAEEQHKLLCVMPRDTDEGVICHLDRPFMLQTNTPVSFPLHASATRLGDSLGDMIDANDEITSLPPLQTSLRFGKRDEKTTIECTLASRLNEIGTLEVWCQATQTDHRFPLTFELRNSSSPSPYDASISHHTVIDENQIHCAVLAISEAFKTPSAPVDSLVKTIEGTLELPRKEWPATLLRTFADTLLEHSEWREISSRHEVRWLNLCGFCMRPGFGVVGDDTRIRRLWKLWHPGLNGNDSTEAGLNWWLLWRRIAGGLSAGQQEQIAGFLSRELNSNDMKTIIKKDDAITLEKWRLLSALEKIQVNLKCKCLNALLNGTGKLPDQAFWPIVRFAARKLFSGPDDAVIPANRLETFLPSLMAKANQANNPPNALLAMASAARLTGILTLDISPARRSEIHDILCANHASQDILQPIESICEQSPDAWTPEILGDTLPLGLQLLNQ
ncbi:MAG: hypothetical protein J6X55_13605, partial [Victivallales bacterium]|nr:hypothetical protein [Victivallales bacterium]